jgi:5-methylcytosine-specific restriction enzyme subunit McrC
MGRLIQVFEYEKLTLFANDNLFGYKLTQSELDKLYEFNDTSNNIYFTAIRNGIKFKSYVGVIQIGSQTIEILPKADRNISKDPTEYQLWSKALLKMLAYCNYIKVDSVSEANLHQRYHSIIDLYFDLYLNEVSRLTHQGLIKKYRHKAENSGAFKGRIIFGKHIQQNLIHQEQTYTSHQVYDYEHTINQILLRALSILNTLDIHSRLKDRIARIKLDFPEINEIAINKNHFEQVTINRKTLGYEEALKIAKMIILNYSPDIRSGHENMIALLFDMNKLWEEYVYRMLIRVKGDKYIVKFQDPKKFWENKIIRPDLVVERKLLDGTLQYYIIDTKWKVITDSSPSGNDLQQMFTYNLYWNAEQSLLLYPRTHIESDISGSFHKKILEDNRCKIGFVSVLDEEGSLDLEIGRKVFEKLEGY